LQFTKSSLSRFVFSSYYKLNLPLSNKGYNYLSSGRRDYSTKSPPQPFSSDILPQPILTLDLNNGDIKSHKSILDGKGGIYFLVNTVNDKRYIGSAKDFFIRLNEHLKY
jgi:hypothetical protein